LSLGKRLKWPDDYFSLSHSISFAEYDVDRYYTWAYPQGKSTSVTFMTNFSRNSIDNPTFPRSGSSFSLTGSLTPPYSLLGGNKDNLLIEYHKWMMDASWFSPLVGKFVLHTRAHLGFLGSYGGKETTRFERFDLGGSGMVQGFSFNRDIVGLRGYKDRVIGPSGSYGNGGVAYNKFVMEVRFPVSLNPSATIFLLAFAEGGNNFSSLKEYSPFNLYKAAGLGARIFMPAFGMIGTLIGLVQMLQNMSDPSSIGPAMAVALLTTFYGSVIANVFTIPVAAKLKQRSKQESTKMNIIVAGVLGIVAGENPRVIREKLDSFLPPKDRLVEEKKD
jgi:outer membrane protein insertion porin family